MPQADEGRGRTGARPSRRDRPVRVAAIVQRGGRILVVRHVHDDAEKEYWVLPGGGLEPGESPARAAARELAEECGLDARVVRLVYALDQPFKGRRQLELYFLCETDSTDASVGAELERPRRGFRNELLWMDPRELAERPFMPDALRERLAADAPGGFIGTVYLEV